MRLLDKLKNVELDNSILKELKENNYMIRDVSKFNDPFLIYNTPKKLYFVKENGEVREAVFKVWYSYIIRDKEKNKLTLKKDSTLVVRIFTEDGEIDEAKTEKIAVRNKVLYELAQKEKKLKGQKDILYDTPKIIHINYSNKSYNKYQIRFQKKDGTKELKKIEAANAIQVHELASNIRANNPQYYKLEAIYRLDFAKTFWEGLFISPQKRKPLSNKDLLEFTRKLYKVHKSDSQLGAVQAIEKLIYSTDGNIRATAIALMAINKNLSIDDARGLYEALNNEDIENMMRPSFDQIYVEVIGLGTGGLDKAYNDMVTIIERRVFLETALKKALKGPLITLGMIVVAGGAIVKLFSTVLFQIYDDIGEPRPATTQAIVNFIDFLGDSLYSDSLFNRLFGSSEDFTHKISYFLSFNMVLIFLTLYLLFIFLKYFVTDNFYGKKALHNIYLTIPIFGDFIKRSDFEIFLTVSRNLYATDEGTHSRTLPLLKNVLRNYHLKGIVHTAYNKFTKGATQPGELFAAYPEYFPEKVALLYKDSSPDSTEMDILTNAYRNDNDDFINNLKAILGQIILFVTGIVVLFILLSTIMPIFNLLDKI